jgi:hypothetical protein
MAHSVKCFVTDLKPGIYLYHHSQVRSGTHEWVPEKKLFKHKTNSRGLGLGMDHRLSTPGRGGERIFSLRHRVQSGSGSHPTCYTVGARILSKGIMRPENETDHSRPSSADDKIVWRCTSNPPICLHGMELN